MKKITLLFFIHSILSIAQTTNIPDTSFEDALIMVGIDTSDPMGFSDGFVYNSDVANVQYLDISNSFITDLTGIEAFVSLTSLNISFNGFGPSNPLAIVDLTNNTLLQNLVCTNSFISDLFLGQNNILETIDCRDNTIITLDISDVPNLESLSAENNNLTSLDLSQHANLQQITLQNNQLVLLNVRNAANTLLTIFNASNNLDLPCIDVDNEVDAALGIGPYLGWLKDTSTIFSNNCSTLNVEHLNIDINNLKILPNPITNAFKIEVNFKINTVEIYTINGEKVKTYKASQESYKIDELQTGVYLVKIYSDKSVITKKLIKQ